MTNEEAIKIIEDMRNNAINLILEKAQIDALDKAIEALNREQQFLDAGYRNRQVEFYIGGRKFMVKELAQ